MPTSSPIIEQRTPTSQAQKMNKSRSMNGKAGRAALFARVGPVATTTTKTAMMQGGDFPSAWDAVKSAASAVAPVAKELAQDGAQAILRTITARLEALLRGASSKPEEEVAVALAASPVKSKIRRNMKVRGAGMAKGSGIGGAAKASSAEDAALANYAQWLSGAPAPAPAPAVGGFILERLNKLVRGAGGSAFDGLNTKRKRAPAKDGDKRKARGAVIAKLMRENPGMTLGAASVHAKQNGMY